MTALAPHLGRSGDTVPGQVTASGGAAASHVTERSGAVLVSGEEASLVNDEEGMECFNTLIKAPL